MAQGTRGIRIRGAVIGTSWHFAKYLRTMLRKGFVPFLTGAVRASALERKQRGDVKT